MTKKITPENLKELFIALQNASLDAIVVGGQAVNLWAYQYQTKCPPLENFLPFASEDLDFYGGKVEADVCHKVLGGQIVLNENFDPTPNAGVVVVDYLDRQLRIDFLASVYGLSESEIEATALPFKGENELAGISLKVLNPILCLEGKLSCLKHLPQLGRQDKKHVEMSILCTREYLNTLCQKEKPRLGLKLVERVLKNALKDNGLSAWYHHNILVENAVPIDTISELNDEKWLMFCSDRLPQIKEQIQNKRQRYARIEEQIEQRKQAINQRKRTEIIAPIVYQLLNNRSLDRLEGMYNTATWNPTTLELTLIDSKSQLPKMIALLSDYGWKSQPLPPDSPGLSEGDVEHFLKISSQFLPIPEPKPIQNQMRERSEEEEEL